MGDVSNRTVVALLAVALVVTVVGTVVSVSKLSSLGGTYGMLTGAQVGAGSSTLTIQGSAGITMDDSAIAFGTGYVNTSCTEAYLVSDGEANFNNCWLNATGSAHAVLDDHHLISNSGTGTANVTVGIDGTDDAEAILCGAGDCPASSNALIQVKTEDGGSGEANACAAGLLTGYTTIASNTGQSNQTLCSQWNAADSKDALEVNYNLTLPSDADQGLKTVSVAYIAELSS